MDELAKAGNRLGIRRRLFGDFIFERQLIHFPSERGTGKTWLLLQLCIAISNCFSKYLNESIERYGNTLFLSFEMSEEDIMERIATLYKKPPEGVGTEISHQSDVLTSKEDFLSIEPQIISIIERKRPVLVVLDNFSIAFTGIEKRGEIARAWRNLLKLKDKYGFSLIVVDHTKKNTRGLATDSDLQSGSGVKSDLSDGDIFIRFSCQNDEFRILKQSKARRTARQTGVKLVRFDSDTCWFRWLKDNADEMEHLNPNVAKSIDHDDLLDMAQTLIDSGKTYQQVAKAVGIPKSTLNRKLRKKNSG